MRAPAGRSLAEGALVASASAFAYLEEVRCPTATTLGWLIAALAVALSAACERTNSAVTVTVTAPAAAAETSGASGQLPTIKVESSGFLQEPNSAADGDFVHFGLVLLNESPLDAREVVVSVNFVSADGGLLATDDWTIERIPAKTKFFYGSSTLDVPPGEVVQTIEPSVTVGTVAPKSRPAFRFTNLRGFREGEGFYVRGEVQNASSTVATGVRLYYVVLDTRGEAIAGGVDATSDITLPAGSRKAFREYVSEATPPGAAGVGASADVCC